MRRTEVRGTDNLSREEDSSPRRYSSPPLSLVPSAYGYSSNKVSKYLTSCCLAFGISFYLILIML